MFASAESAQETRYAHQQDTRSLNNYVVAWHGQYAHISVDTQVDKDARSKTHTHHTLTCHMIPYLFRFRQYAVEMSPIVAKWCTNISDLSLGPSLMTAPINSCRYI